MRFSERGRVVKKAELSLTPMIDVVFLLLIFFMVGMKFKELDRKLLTDLPREGDPPKDQIDPIVNEIWIRIDARGPAGTGYAKVVIDQILMRSWAQTRGHLARLAGGKDVVAIPVRCKPDRGGDELPRFLAGGEAHVLAPLEEFDLFSRHRFARPGVPKLVVPH